MRFLLTAAFAALFAMSAAQADTLGDAVAYGTRKTAKLMASIEEFCSVYDTVRYQPEAAMYASRMKAELRSLTYSDNPLVVTVFTTALARVEDCTR